MMTEEENPFKNYDPDKPLPKPVTDEQLEEASEKMVKTGRNPYLSYAALFLVFFWCLGHAYILYMMIGTPLAGAIFPIVAVNLMFLTHYSIMLVVNIGRHRHELR